MHGELFYIYMHYFCRGSILENSYDDVPESVGQSVINVLVSVDFKNGLADIIDPEKIRLRGMPAIHMMNYLIDAQNAAESLIMKYINIEK